MKPGEDAPPQSQEYDIERAGRDLRDIYEKAASQPELKKSLDLFGFKIFNSPPVSRPEILFIGYQPGGGDAEWRYERSRESHKIWPSEVEYRVASWALAVNIREIFSNTEVDLRKTVGMNALFVRAPSVEVFKSKFSKLERDNIKNFCIEEAKSIVKFLQPKIIVAIGLGTLDLFGKSKPDLVGARNRQLAATGSIEGIKTLGVIHLTGARISKLDRESLYNHIRGYFR